MKLSPVFIAPSSSNTLNLENPSSVDLPRSFITFN